MSSRSSNHARSGGWGLLEHADKADAKTAARFWFLRCTQRGLSLALFHYKYPFSR